MGQELKHWSQLHCNKNIYKYNTKQQKKCEIDTKIQSYLKVFISHLEQLRLLKVFRNIFHVTVRHLWLKKINCPLHLNCFLLSNYHFPQDLSIRYFVSKYQYFGKRH